MRRLRFAAIGVAVMAAVLAAPAYAGTDSWSTNMNNTGSYDWNNAVFWSGGIPLAGDDVFMTNAITQSRVITNGLLSINLASFTMGWNSVNTGTFNMTGAANTTNYFVVTGTTIIGSNAVFNLSPASTGGAFMTNNNLYLVDNGKIFASSGGRRPAVVVTGSFSNSVNTVIEDSVVGSMQLVFTADAMVTNNGTIRFARNANNGTAPPLFSIGNTNTLLNVGTLEVRTTSNPSLTQVLPLNALLVNRGMVLLTNNTSTTTVAIGGGITVTGKTGQAVTNEAEGTIKFYTIVGATGAGGAMSFIVNNGGLVNQGLISSEMNTSAKTNFIQLAASGQVFSNAPGGQVTVISSNFAIRAARIINLGTNTVQSAGTLLYQTSAGAANVFENAGVLRVDGVAKATAITNQAGGLIQGTGVINANVLGLSGSTITPGNGLGTQNITGNVTIGSNATFSVELSLANGTSDLLGITGNLTLDGNSILDITGGIAGNIYTVATFNVSSLVGTFGTVTPGYSVGYDNAGGVLTVVVPEPSALVLVGAGLVGLVAVMKRRNW